MSEKYKTINKIKPSVETVGLLRQKLKYDIELYNFIKQRFFVLKRFINGKKVL